MCWFVGAEWCDTVSCWLYYIKVSTSNFCNSSSGTFDRGYQIQGASHSSTDDRMQCLPVYECLCIVNSFFMQLSVVAKDGMSNFGPDIPQPAVFPTVNCLNGVFRCMLEIHQTGYMHALIDMENWLVSASSLCVLCLSVIPLSVAPDPLIWARMCFDRLVICRVIISVLGCWPSLSMLRLLQRRHPSSQSFKYVEDSWVSRIIEA